MRPPLEVADIFRQTRIVSFSTACVYPFVPVDGPGADESMPATPPAGCGQRGCSGAAHGFGTATRPCGQNSSFSPTVARRARAPLV